jgi:hypothetical protein
MVAATPIEPLGREGLELREAMLVGERVDAHAHRQRVGGVGAAGSLGRAHDEREAAAVAVVRLPGSAAIAVRLPD